MQFAWMFILVAGAIILIFFVSIVFKQKSLSEQKLASDVQIQLESILTGAGLSPGASNIIDTPKIEIEFICDKEGYSAYKVKGAVKPEEIPMQVVFAPDKISGTKLISWALEWDAPFKVTNFLYLSSPRVKYVLIRPLPAEIERDIPMDFNIETADSVFAVSAEGVDKIRFVFYNKDLVFPSHINPKKIEVSAVKIVPGEVKFFKAENRIFKEEGSMPYMDMPSLYGAIVAEDFTFYECAMKKAFKRLSLVSQVYADRENEIKNNAQESCRLYYLNEIEKLASDSKNCQQDIKTCITNIMQDIAGVKTNQETLIRKSCPLLY